jgi:hypothetical protein
MLLDYDWLDEVDVRVHGEARDLVVDASGTSRVVQESLVTMETSEGLLATVMLEPDEIDHTALIGVSPRQGFRRHVRNLYGDATSAGSTLALLLDDLPAALVVAGYVHARARRADGRPGPSLSSGYVPQADLCAGWRADGTMMVAIRSNEELPFLPIPPVPNPAPIDQEWPTRAIPAPGLRRARRIDVTVEPDRWQVDAWFRDTYSAPDGKCGAVHEYTLDATINPEDHSVREIRAVPHALPWFECPAAADPISKLVGSSVDAFRTEVPLRLTGVECCTHLNNELRALADLPHMVDAFEPSADASSTR